MRQATHGSGQRNAARRDGHWRAARKDLEREKQKRTDPEIRGTWPNPIIQKPICPHTEKQRSQRP